MNHRLAQKAMHYGAETHHENNHQHAVHLSQSNQFLASRKSAPRRSLSETIQAHQAHQQLNSSSTVHHELSQVDETKPSSPPPVVTPPQSATTVIAPPQPPATVVTTYKHEALPEKKSNEGAKPQVNHNQVISTDLTHHLHQN